MKIRYNIAKKRKIDYLRYILLSGVLLVFSLGFILVGIKTLSTTAQQFRNKKNELKRCEEEKQVKARKNKEQKSEIVEIKKKWKNRRVFANSIVQNKTFPYLEQLDKLEKLLPEGTFISLITLGTEEGSRITFNLSAISSSRLLEAYNIFSQYDQDIQNERQKEGLYNATIKIKLDHTK
jgi:hypothetical protein